MTTNRSHPVLFAGQLLLRALCVSVCVFALLAPPTWAQDAHPIDSEHWALVKMGRERTKRTGAYIEFNTAESSFSGYTGCNWMGGTVELTGKRMRFKSIGQTKRLCIGRPDPMKLEKRYLKYLLRTTRYRQKGPILRLYARNRLLLRFRAMDVPPEGVDRVFSQ